MRTHRIQGERPHPPGAAIPTDGARPSGDTSCMIKNLAAAALSLVIALAAASPAPASTFTAPRTLADWGPGGDTLAVAPGAAAWSHPTGVRIARAGAAPIRVPGEGLVQDMDVASAHGQPVAAWADSGARLHAFTGRETIVTGTMDGIRKVAATPNALAWIGMPSSGDRKLQ